MGALSNATVLGIDNVKALVSGVAGMATAVGEVMADGKVGVGDLSQVPAIFAAIRSVAAADLGQILPEMKDLSDPERVDLAAHFAEKFNLPSDAVEVTIEQGMEILLSALQAVLAFMTVKARIGK